MTTATSDSRLCKFKEAVPDYGELPNIKAKIHLNELGMHSSLATWPHHKGDQFNRTNPKERRLRELPYVQLFVLISPQPWPT